MKHSQKTVLVTGGPGFVGRAVVKLLQREGYDVVSLDQAPAADNSGDRISKVQCNITDTAALRFVFETRVIGAIVHLAAVLPTAAQRDPARATQVNVLGSLNLLEMARQFGIRRFVFGSSVSIYGSCAMDHVVSEQDRAAPEDLYGDAKLYIEQLGQIYREHQGMEFVSLRIARVVGPGANSKTSAWRSEIFELVNTKNVGETLVPYVESERILVVHVEDVARMLLALLAAEKPAHCIYNAVCESVLVGELMRAIEGLNASVRVKLGDSKVAGNPRQLDSSRFAEEFGWRNLSIFEQLAKAAGADAGATL